MAIESATFLTQLVSSNPPAGDPVANAADHLRLIKSVLQASLPNINAAVTATPKNLNSDTVPVGGIIMWSGATTAVPTSWGLCDGSTYAKTDGSGNLTAPDLRNAFIVGAGSTYGVGTTGGAVSNTPTISGTALTQAQLPSCSFSAVSTAATTLSLSAHLPKINLNGPYTYNGLNSGGEQVLANSGGAADTGAWFIPQTNIVFDSSAASTLVTTTVASGGSGSTHTHTSSVVPTLPPYYALAFIIKL